jgi:hypothetical protein
LTLPSLIISTAFSNPTIDATSNTLHFGWYTAKPVGAAGTNLVFINNSTDRTTTAFFQSRGTVSGVDSFNLNCILNANASGSCAIFGPTALASTNLTVRGSSTQSVDICIAGGGGAYSSSSATGDTVIRAINGNMLLQRGTGSYMAAITSTSFLVAGNLGVGANSPNAPLQFANVAASRKIVLFEGANNDHQFMGFGVNSNVLRYQVDTTSVNHIFYAATSSSASNELARISGNGNFSAAGTSTLGGNVGIKVYTASGTLSAVGASHTISIPSGVTASNVISMAGVVQTAYLMAAFDTRDPSFYWAFYFNNVGTITVVTGPSASVVAGSGYRLTFITNS